MAPGISSLTYFTYLNVTNGESSIVHARVCVCVDASVVCYKMIEVIDCLLFFFALTDWTFPRSDFSMPGPPVSMPGPSISMPGPSVSMPGPSISVPGPSVSSPGPSATANGTVPDFPVLPDIPDLPSIPTHSVGRSSVTSDDVDFDDLTKRFEELKKRK